MISREDGDRLRREHRQLRVLLARLEESGARVLGEIPGGLGDLREAVRELDVSFRAHLLTEETALVPLLSPAALARLHEEHTAQRAALAAISYEAELDTKPPTRLADDALWLVRGLLRDMHDEDAALDALSVSHEGGER